MTFDDRPARKLFGRFGVAAGVLIATSSGLFSVGAVVNAVRSAMSGYPEVLNLLLTPIFAAI